MTQDTTRRTFHQELVELEGGVVELAARVSEACSAATEALLTGDATLAATVANADAIVDDGCHVLEERAYELLARQQPTASDLRVVLAGLGLLSEIERTGSLAAHIAGAVHHVPVYALTPKVRGLLTRMGEVGRALLDRALSAYTSRDGEVAADLESLDDEVDTLHTLVLAELFTTPFELEVVIELALIARYYERIADHAVAMGQRVAYLVSGNLS